ncbi:hypothetical protein STEG23_009133, partial [Scotinomys teguina]
LVELMEIYRIMPPSHYTVLHETSIATGTLPPSAKCGLNLKLLISQVARKAELADRSIEVLFLKAKMRNNITQPIKLCRFNNSNYVLTDPKVSAREYQEDTEVDYWQFSSINACVSKCEMGYVNQRRCVFVCTHSENSISPITSGEQTKAVLTDMTEPRVTAKKKQDEFQIPLSEPEIQQENHLDP